jgi:hypothetical protein
VRLRKHGGEAMKELLENKQMGVQQERIPLWGWTENRLERWFGQLPVCPGRSASRAKHSSGIWMFHNHIKFAWSTMCQNAMVTLTLLFNTIFLKLIEKRKGVFSLFFFFFYMRTGMGYYFRTWVP